jgi:anthranilate phosphoribosyltransferase
MRVFAYMVYVPDRSMVVDFGAPGGDGAHTFNISTAAMFVCAAAGACVAKHGNRSVSSKSGSADVLEALGANIELGPEAVSRCIADTGIGFMYAPLHHPAMRNVAPVRKELGVRTLFNILGPLTNPAGAPNILMGVFHADLVGIQARVLQRLGAKRALVVHGRDGLDELTLSGATLVAELREDRIEEYEVLPGEFGLRMADAALLRVDGPEDSRRMVLEVLADKDGPARDIVLLNAGAALYAAGVAASIGDGIEKARLAVSGGAARARLDAYVAATQRFANPTAEHR